MRISSNGEIDALEVEKVLYAPLCVAKDTNTKMYLGFIPGFLMKNIEAPTIEDCKKDLKAYLQNKLKTMVKNNEPFPFFPSKKEILEDYKNIVDIEIVKLYKNKK